MSYILITGAAGEITNVSNYATNLRRVINHKQSPNDYENSMQNIIVNGHLSSPYNLRNCKITGLNRKQYNTYSFQGNKTTKLIFDYPVVKNLIKVCCSGK